MPPQRHIQQPKVRQRSSRACDPCRKRKVKCDGKFPCEVCAGYGYECLYSSEQTSRARPDQVGSNSPKNTTKSSEMSSNSAFAGKDDTAPYVATETLIQDSDADHFLLLPWKTRFTSAHSAIAMPRSLGMSLGLQNPPRLQSFGWNAGTRSEPKIHPQVNICNIISLEQMKPLIEVYFNEVHPIFGILDREMFNLRFKEHWPGGKRSTDFEACVCGVLALGSYFSEIVSSPIEAQIVEQGRILLDLSVAHAPGLLSFKHVSAWVLRAIYLRLTTRPHLSWMASCTAVHIAESVGLHRELCETRSRQEPSREINKIESDLRRKVFWVAIAMNQFMSSEYGRTRVHIDAIGCEPLRPKAGDLTAEAVAIFLSVPKHQNPSSRLDLLDALKSAVALPTKAPFLGLLRADACFCIYRMLRITNVALPETLMSALLDIIRVSLDGVKFLCSMRHPWWNIVSVPFHSICVLLAIGTSNSLAMVPVALETLKNTVALYNSHLSREALSTAYALTKALHERKKKELEVLDKCLDIVSEVPDVQMTPSKETIFEWPQDGDIGFSDFINLQDYEIDVSEAQDWPSLI